MIIITAHWEILTEIPMSAAGFSGIVGTGWGGEFRVLMTFKFGVGGRFGVMRAPCAVVALLGHRIVCVGFVSARRYFSGHMILLFDLRLYRGNRGCDSCRYSE